MAKITRRTADEVLSFLDAQRLDPTPQNYTLGYHHIAGTNKAIGKAVAAITDDGIRISQDQVDEIMLSNGLGDVSAAVPADDGRDQVRMQMLRLSDLANSQSAATTRFGRDLTEGMGRIGDTAGDVTAVVATMIQRTEAAERELAATAAEVGRLRQDLEAARTDANVDALTGLPNRRSVDALLAKIEKAGRPRAIAFIDVDRFKNVNDTYGHAVGDRVLKGVAEVLSQTCGRDAVVARWGGEEFVVVMDKGTASEAARIVDQAREVLTAKRFKLRETDQPLGVVSFSAGVCDGTGPTTELTGKADALLYQAKQEGRNRVLTA